MTEASTLPWLVFLQTAHGHQSCRKEFATQQEAEAYVWSQMNNEETRWLRVDIALSMRSMVRRSRPIPYAASLNHPAFEEVTATTQRTVVKKELKG